MAKTLTVKTIENTRPGVSRREIPDGGCRGLYFIIQPSGARSWACRYRHNGQPQKLTLGAFPKIQLAEARKLASAALHEVATGGDPAADKHRSRAQARERNRDTVERLAAQFIEEHAKRKTRASSWKATQRTFENDALPRWRGRLVTDIRRRDVIELIEAIARTRPIQANRALAHISRFFRWLAARDVIAASPCIGIERPEPERRRERVLSDDEVRRFWAATDQLQAPLNDIYKLLLLTAARRNEILFMRWRELDLTKKIWTLPAERSKNGFTNVLPLGPLAWAIIERQPRFAGSEQVFGPGRGNFCRAKPVLDKAMQPDEPWVNHDLRRTARSLLSRAHILSDVAELMLGHLLKGMRRTYDKHQYLDEKRAGFVALEREVDLILSPPAADIIPLRR
jgi:integrase